MIRVLNTDLLHHTMLLAGDGTDGPISIDERAVGRFTECALDLRRKDRRSILATRTIASHSGKKPMRADGPYAIVPKPLVIHKSTVNRETLADEYWALGAIGDRFRALYREGGNARDPHNQRGQAGSSNLIQLKLPHN